MDFWAAVESTLHVLSTWQKKAGASVAVDASLFENDQEKALAKAIEELELRPVQLATNWLNSLLLGPVIDAFFDNTMVMAEDEALKTTVWPFLQVL